MDPFSRLSLDQLALVLSHVNIKHRLSACSRVSTTWRAAAAAQATTALQIDNVSRLRTWAIYSLWRWLRSHTATVQLSTLSVADWDGGLSELALPLSQMPSLKSLTLERLKWKPVTGAAASATAAATPAAAAASQPESDAVSAPLSSSFGQEGLQPLTALTQLQLTGSSVRLSGLSALTALQELACEGYESSTGTHRYSIPWDSLKTLEVDLISAFPQLQRLTKLKLVRAAGSPAVVSHISALQSLQRLMVDKTSANSFPQLPQSLTHLHFMPAQPCSLTRSNAAGLSQLTALQYLGLSAQPFDMACLTSMRRLQKLKFLCAEVAPGQLQVISRLTGLTSFVISVTKPRRDASPVIISGAEAGALTSSSQLVRLSLSSETGRPLLDDCASLFPPGRQLQHLTRLRLGADFLQDAEAVEQAGVCCPNLRYAKFGKLPKRYRCYRWHNAQADEEEVNQDDEEAEDWLADGLSAMADGWKNLRMLRLNNPLQTVPGWFIWEALGKFSQLHDLRIQIELPEAEQPEEYDVVLLEGCKELRHLFIGVRADAPWEDDAFRSWRLHMKSTAAPGESPNVWSGLSNQLEWTDGRYYPSAEVGDV